MNDNTVARFSDAEVARVRAHTAAAARLLLGGGTMESGVLISGGGRLDADARIEFGLAASLSNADLIHLEFDYSADDEYGLVGIVLICPRDGVCHIQTGCQLYISKRGKRAMILPKPTVRGAFRFGPNELIHVLQKPSDATAGILKAARLITAASVSNANKCDRFQLIDAVRA